MIFIVFNLKLYSEEIWQIGTIEINNFISHKVIRGEFKGEERYRIRNVSGLATRTNYLEIIYAKEFGFRIDTYRINALNKIYPIYGRREEVILIFSD
jgi:hypothetical protein